MAPCHNLHPNSTGDYDMDYQVL